MEIVIYVVVGLVFVCFAEVMRRLRTMDARTSHIPSVPRESFLNGSASSYFGNGFKSLQLVEQESRSRGYTPWVVPGGIFAPSYVIISSSKDAFKILQKCTHKGHVPSGLYYPGTPRTIVTSEGLQWKQRRGALGPVFAHSNVKGAVSLIDTVAKTAVDYLKVQGGKPIDSNELCGRITLDIIGYLLYGESFDSVPDPKHPAARAAHDLSLFSAKNFCNPLRRYLRIGKKEYDKVISVFDKIAEAQLEKVPTAGNNASTVLHLMQNATKQDGTKEWADLDQYLEELRLVINASHDPAIPMSFALFEMSRNPDMAKRARREIESVLGDRQEITFDDLSQLEYVTAIFKEALRMWPVSGIGIGRMIETEMEVSGTRLPPGQMVLIPFYTVMRSAQEWKAPDEFHPERFLTQESADAAANNNRIMLTFSAGLRMCPGFQFALYEGVIILSHLLRHFDFHFNKSGDPTLDCGIHVMPKDLIMTASLVKR